MRKLVFIGLPVFIVATYFLYQSMGGGTTVEYHLSNISAAQVGGSDFEGKMNASRLEELFLEYRNLSNFEDSTFLVVVNYPQQGKDSVRQFIGVLGYTKASGSYQMRAGRYVEAVLTMHPAVRPSPDKVGEDAATFASDNGYELSGEEIQIYEGEEVLRILFPVTG